MPSARFKTLGIVFAGAALVALALTMAYVMTDSGQVSNDLLSKSMRELKTKDEDVFGSKSTAHVVRDDFNEELPSEEFEVKRKCKKKKQPVEEEEEVEETSVPDEEEETYEVDTPERVIHNLGFEGIHVDSPQLQFMSGRRMVVEPGQ